MILDGKISLGTVVSEKESGLIAKRSIRQDTLRFYYKAISESDAVLVLNYSKNSVKGYIGGNVLVEMAFAHVLGKGLFLLNPIPDVSYRDVIEAMTPNILDGEIQSLRQRLPARTCPL